MFETLIKCMLEQMFGRQVSLYTIPQFLWLCELYYLTMNALWKIFSLLVPGFARFAELPAEIMYYNQLILQYFDEYHSFLILIGIILFISSYLIELVSKYPMISTSAIIRTHAKFGQTTSIWFLLIGITYFIYAYSQALFPIFIVMLFAIFYSWKKG